ncbi:hypothetical protein T439DRAFT_323827 [Meredithblackwellia eburnea MCA 4105]
MVPVGEDNLDPVMGQPTFLLSNRSLPSFSLAGSAFATEGFPPSSSLSPTPPFSFLVNKPLSVDLRQDSTTPPFHRSNSYPSSHVHQRPLSSLSDSHHPTSPPPPLLPPDMGVNVSAIPAPSYSQVQYAVSSAAFGRSPSGFADLTLFGGLGTLKPTPRVAGNPPPALMLRHEELWERNLLDLRILNGKLRQERDALANLLRARGQYGGLADSGTGPASAYKRFIRGPRSCTTCGRSGAVERFPGEQGVSGRPSLCCSCVSDLVRDILGGGHVNEERYGVNFDGDRRTSSPLSLAATPGTNTDGSNLARGLEEDESGHRRRDEREDSLLYHHPPHPHVPHQHHQH